MRVLICSGRFYAGISTLTRVLDLYSQSENIRVLIHGGHPSSGGAIEHWARDANVHIVRYPANWAAHGKYAEIRRNIFMLEDSRPDIILAFSGGEDTADCIGLAKSKGIKVIEIDDYL
ncbi:SLOG family protein [Rahnella sp. PCH160]|uniref:SLOG family protein n=1 Tax=Rahnella sp. PCH160 TaxID=3447928 RepID=UPI0039FCBE01